MPTSALVIDDDAMFRELVIEMLEGMGLSVVGEADTVEAAGAAARNLRPQAALVDIALPDDESSSRNSLRRHGRPASRSTSNYLVAAMMSFA